MDIPVLGRLGRRKGEEKPAAPCCSTAEFVFKSFMRSTDFFLQSHRTSSAIKEVCLAVRHRKKTYFLANGVRKNKEISLKGSRRVRHGRRNPSCACSSFFRHPICCCLSTRNESPGSVTSRPTRSAGGKQKNKTEQRLKRKRILWDGEAQNCISVRSIKLYNLLLLRNPSHVKSEGTIDNELKTRRRIKKPGTKPDQISANDLRRYFRCDRGREVFPLSPVRPVQAERRTGTRSFLSPSRAIIFFTQAPVVFPVF